MLWLRLLLSLGKFQCTEGYRSHLTLGMEYCISQKNMEQKDSSLHVKMIFLVVVRSEEYVCNN